MLLTEHFCSRSAPLLPALLLCLVYCNQVCAVGEKAEVTIRASGACSPVYLRRKGINLSDYRPKIRFNPDKIQLVPKNPIVPGCIKIRAEGVEIVEPVQNLVAEIEMRIGGTPDPRKPTLPCNKKLDQKANSCRCDKSDGACVFCDFCKQMRAQSPNVVVNKQRRKSFVGATDDQDQCSCETLEPALYDIETEICTPDLDDAREYIPPEIQNDILERRPISMFITVYLMDLEQHSYESYLSALGRAILRRRQAQSTVACFLIGTDVQIGNIGGLASGLPPPPQTSVGASGGFGGGNPPRATAVKVAPFSASSTAPRRWWRPRIQ